MGYSQEDFLRDLAVVLQGEARKCLDKYIAQWFDSVEDATHPNHGPALWRRNVSQLWVDYRSDRMRWVGHRLLVGGQAPALHNARNAANNEPAEIQDFFRDLKRRFKTSTTEAIDQFVNLKVEAGDTVETIFTKFDDPATIVEASGELTGRQLALNLYELLRAAVWVIMSASGSTYKAEAARRRAADLPPMDRHDIRDYALEVEREISREAAELRSARIVPTFRAATTTRGHAPSSRSLAFVHTQSLALPVLSAGVAENQKSCYNCGLLGHINKGMPFTKTCCFRAL